MKLLRVGEYGNEVPAIFDEKNKIRNLSSILKDFNPDNLNFKTLNKIKKLDLSSLPIIDDYHRIGSCVVQPANFIAIGLNYKAHAAETNSDAPKEPIVFNKSPNCIIGPNDNVVIPKLSKSLDHEVEIAMVIGKRAKHVKEEQAQDYIIGYCICNDISEREWQKERGGQWVKGKSGDTFGPLGPYLVTKDEISDPQNLSMWLDVNGQRMQDGSTKTMVYSVNFLVSYLSKFMSLQAGDIISTGTPPGVGMGMKPQVFLKPGDEMKLGVEGLGEQIQKTIAA